MSTSAPPTAKVKQLRGETEAMARRRMRKGTRSCLQCRSRKVRCTYPPNSNECHSCLAHGRDCTEQTYQDVKNGGLDKRVGLKERVRELESLVQQLVDKGGPDARAIEQSLRRTQDSDRMSATTSDFLSPPASTSSGKGASPIDQFTEPPPVDDVASDSTGDDDFDNPENDAGDFQKAPLMSLLNNSMLQSSEVTYPIRGGPKPASSTKAARQAKLVTELRALALPMDNIRILVPKLSGILSVFQELLTHDPDMNCADLEKEIERRLASDKPIEILMVLCFLMAVVQQADPVLFTQNPHLLGGMSPVDLIHKYTDRLEQHLCGVNSMIGSLEGLECAVMLSKTQFNDGRPRRSWLLNQRALSYCKLMGFHRPSSWKTSPDPMIGMRRYHVWVHLFVGDRSSSLLLGLPYSTPAGQIEKESENLAMLGPDGTPDKRGPLVAIVLQLGMVAGHITDRNQSSVAGQASSYTDTMKIDGQLQALQLLMPKKWWALSEDDYDTCGYMDLPVREIMESSMIQTWCHECRIALHLPFMMKNAGDGQSSGQYEYSRRMATNSARALIRCHLRMRSRAELTTVVCLMIDFQVFNSTVLLILDLLSRSREKGKAFWMNKDDETLVDLVLIKEAYEMLLSLSQKSIARANIPGQAIKVLETLGCLIKGCAVPGLDKESKIMIPYFGALTIKPSKALQEQARSMPQDAGCEAGMPSLQALEQQRQRQRWDPSPQLPQYAESSISSMPTPTSTESFQASPVSNIGWQPSDFTFNPFTAPGDSLNFAPPISYDEVSDIAAIVPDATMLYAGAGNMGEGYVPKEAFDTNMWDESQWQQMGLDPGLDLDNSNWGFFPVEGAA